MKYIVYCTFNKVNGKYYIGVHKTETPWIFDNYLGCGAYIDKPSSYNKGKVPLHAAILKYGLKSFYRVTLAVFNTEEEALNLEALIVTQEFINSPNTYNATLGGGLPPLLNNPIYQFDLNGNLIKKWESRSDVNRYFNTSVSFTDIIRDKRTFAGYIWSDIDFVNPEEYKKSVKYGFISQYDINGNFIAKYKSATEASQKLDIKRERIVTAVYSQKPLLQYYFIKSDIDIYEVISKKFKQLRNRRPVYRYLPSGEFDREFETSEKAIHSIPQVRTHSLKDAVVNGKLCGGFYWSYKKGENYFNIENVTKYLKPTKIIQYDKEGNLIKVWDSIQDCKKEFRYCLRVCNGSLKSTKGYIFKYLEEE